VEDEGIEPAVWAAIEKERTAVGHGRHSGRAWGRLGMVLFAHSFLDEAAVCFERAEQLQPSEPRWPYHQAALIFVKDAEGAVPKLRRTAELCGDRFDTARLRLGDLLLSLGRYDEAREQFQHILQLQPSHSAAHLGLARAAWDQGDASGSLEHLAHSVTDPHTRKAAHALMAVVYRRLNDQKAAENELRVAESLPNDTVWPDALSKEVQELRRDKVSRLVFVIECVEENRYSEGMAVLQQLIHEYPEWHLPWRVMGVAFLSQGNVEEAERALGMAIRLAPASAQNQNYMGLVNTLRGKHSLALACFRRAAQLKPDYAYAHYNLGECLRKQGDRAGAIEAYRMALRIRPYFAEAHSHVGDLLAQSGQKAEALEHLRQAAALNADEKAKKLVGDEKGDILR
jgi:tetratricopeptide (TPR) repeat protein